MQPIPTRQLGRSGVHVTEIGFGGAPIGGFRAHTDENEVQALLDTAWQGGMRYFDTSPYYGYGRSELRMGQYLRTQPRDQFVISSKIGRVMRPLRSGEAPPPDFRENGLPGFMATYDYSYDGVMRSLEQSWMRTGLARIDVVFIHDIDFWTIRDRALLDERFRTVMEGGYRALDELRRAGVIGAIGAGLNEADMCLRFARAGDFDCMLLAGRYTLLEQESLDDFMPHAEKNNIGVIIGGPYNSGILTGAAGNRPTYDYAAAPPELLERARRLEAVCARHGIPLPAAALQFVLHHPAVAAVIPGALSAAEVEQNLAHLRRPIPAALWQELKREGLLRQDAPVPV